MRVISPNFGHNVLWGLSGSPICYETKESNRKLQELRNFCSLISIMLHMRLSCCSKSRRAVLSHFPVILLILVQTGNILLQVS